MPIPLYSVWINLRTMYLYYLMRVYFLLFLIQNNLFFVTKKVLFAALNNLASNQTVDGTIYKKRRKEYHILTSYTRIHIFIVSVLSINVCM